MYTFYADESGFSKWDKLDKNQPILVVSGILICIDTVTKAVKVFDTVLKDMINVKLPYPVSEMKFSAIRNKSPYREGFPILKNRIALFTKIIKKFQQELEFKVFYCAIDSKAFYNLKKTNTLLKTHLTHPYLCASYKVISELEHL